MFVATGFLTVITFQANNLLKNNEKLQVLYIKDDEPFQEVTDFIEMSKEVYNLVRINVLR